MSLGSVCDDDSTGRDNGWGWAGLRNYRGNIASQPNENFYRWADDRPLDGIWATKVNTPPPPENTTDCLKTNFKPAEFGFHHVDCSVKLLFACQFRCDSPNIGKALLFLCSCFL